MVSSTDVCIYPLINEQTKMTATSSMPGRGAENARLLGRFFPPDQFIVLLIPRGVGFRLLSFLDAFGSHYSHSSFSFPL